MPCGRAMMRCSAIFVMPWCLQTRQGWSPLLKLLACTAIHNDTDREAFHEEHNPDSAGQAASWDHVR